MTDPETRASLLNRLCDPASNEAWTEFVDLYRPLVYRVARTRGLQHADAEDLTQEVFTAVGRAIGAFDTQAGGSFRGWLFQITRNLCVNHLTRNRGPIGSGDSEVQRQLSLHPDTEATMTLFRLEHRRLQFRLAAQRLRSEFSEPTWNAFWLTAVAEKSIGEAARQLGKTEGAVRVARCRVLARLREELLDKDEST